MRTEKKQQELDNLTQTEKYILTSLEGFKRRGTLIREYEYRYLTKNEYPHKDRGDKQFVIWRKDNKGGYDYEELFKIRKQYNELNLLNSGEKSVKYREHFHLYN